MAFVFAALVLVAAIILQGLIVLAEMNAPIPDKGFLAMFWPLVVGVPLAALIGVSYWLHVGW